MPGPDVRRGKRPFYGGAQIKRAPLQVLFCMYQFNALTLSSDLEQPHHAGAKVFRDVAVEHPVAGVTDVEQDIDGVPRRNEHGVFPDEIARSHSIIR